MEVVGVADVCVAAACIAGENVSEGVVGVVCSEGLALSFSSVGFA